MLDVSRVFSDEHRREILDGADDGAGLPFQRRLAPAEQAVLVGEDLHEDPIAHLRVDDDCSYGCDFHKGCCYGEVEPQISPLRYAPVEMTILFEDSI